MANNLTERQVQWVAAAASAADSGDMPPQLRDRQEGLIPLKLN